MFYSANLATFTLGSGPLVFSSPSGTISISGPSAATGNTILISGNNTSGLLIINSPTNLANLTLTNANGGGKFAVAIPECVEPDI
ncbi:MAG: hypothetical protein ACKO0V_18385 [bacterium]